MKLLAFSALALSALLSIAAEDTSDATPQPDCYTSLSDVYDQLENHYEDNGEVRRFVVCPNTVLDIGVLKPGVGIEDGQSPIIPRPNTEFLCGHDGKASNNCVLNGGDFGVIIVPVFFRQDRKVENVKISGFTFRGQNQYAVFAASEGDLEINDCVFEDATMYGPVVFNYDSTLDLSGKGEEKVSKEGTTLDVLVEDCTFRNLRQRELALGVESGIVTAKGADNVLTMQNCLFANNHYGDESVAPTGYAVKSENATVTLENNCFIDNEFRGTGAVLVGHQDKVESTGNFATEDPRLDCALGAISTEDEDFECIPNDQAETCNIDWYAGNNLHGEEEEAAKEA